MNYFEQIKEAAFNDELEKIAFDPSPMIQRLRKTVKPSGAVKKIVSRPGTEKAIVQDAESKSTALIPSTSSIPSTTIENKNPVVAVPEDEKNKKGGFIRGAFRFAKKHPVATAVVGAGTIGYGAGRINKNTEEGAPGQTYYAQGPSSYQ